MDVEGLSPAEKRARRRLIAAVTIFVVIVLALSAMFFRTIQRRFDAARKLDQAMAIAEKVDPVVLDVDRAVQADVTSENAEMKARTAKRIDSARADLERLVALAEQAYPPLNDDEREQDQLLRQAAEARLDMLRLAGEVLDLDAASMAAATSAEQGWAEIGSARRLGEQAIAEYNKLNSTAVKRSDSLLAQADARLLKAQEHFSVAATDLPVFDPAPYVAHVATLRKLVALGRASNAQWLAGKVDAANSYSKQYNSLERTAAGQESALPTSTADAVSRAYETKAKPLLDRYLEVRARAVKLTEELRNL